MSRVYRFVLFGVVGAVGFVVDALVLYAVRGSFGLYHGRVLSFVVAVFVTWLLNKNLTFRDRKSAVSKKIEFLLYLFLMMVGGVVNFGVYAELIHFYEFVMLNPVVGVAAGSVAGMFVNLLSSRFLLFRFGRTGVAPGNCVRCEEDGSVRMLDPIESAPVGKDRRA